MQTLFTHEDQFRDYIPLNKTYKLEAIKPRIWQAQRTHILPILGRILLEQLLLFVNDVAAYQNAITSIAAQNAVIAQRNIDFPENPLPLIVQLPSVELMTALLPYVRLPLIALAYELHIPWAQLDIGASGIRIIVSESHKTAFQWQINDLEGSARLLGYDGLEALLEFLQDNKTDYPSWALSEAYSEFVGTFINNSAEFSAFFAFNLLNKRLTFLRVRGIMKRVETQIKGITCVPLYNELKLQQKEGNLSPDNLVLMEFIKSAVALLSMHRAFLEMSVKVGDEGVMLFNNNNSQTTKVLQPAELARLQEIRLSLETEGKSYLAQLAEHLNKNLDTYPLFRDSPCYQPTYDPRFKNLKSNSIYFAG